MRKMKKLLQLRNHFIPWFHWCTIHFVLNTVSLLTLFIAICFTGITGLATTWFIACMVQYFPIFILFAIEWIFENRLSRNALAIIKRKLDEANIGIKSTNVYVANFQMHSCVVEVQGTKISVLNEKKLMDIIRKVNRNFENRYSIIYVKKNL